MARRRWIAVGASRVSRRSAVAVLCVITAWCAAGAVTASAKPVDVRSERFMLGAYKQFLGKLESRMPASTQADDAYIASISAACANVLAPISSLASVNVDALSNVGTEGGLNLLLTADVPDRAALTSFSAKVSRLAWSSHSSKLTIRRYFAAAHTVYWMAPGDLCSDASAFVTSNGQTTPTPTTQLLAAIADAGRASARATSDMRKLLRRYAAKSDAGLTRAINKLVNGLRSDQKALSNAEFSKLLTALGLPTQ